MQPTPEDAKGFITVAGILVAIGGYIHKVRTHGARLKKLEEAVAAIPEDIKRRLYDDKSQPIYTPMATCKDSQSACAGNFKVDITRVEKKIDKLIDLHLKGVKE